MRHQVDVDAPPTTGRAGGTPFEVSYTVVVRRLWIGGFPKIRWRTRGPMS